MRELWSTYEVAIHDARRQYSVGRSFAQYNEDEGGVGTAAGAGANVGADSDSMVASNDDLVDDEKEAPLWQQRIWDSEHQQTLKHATKTATKNWPII